MDRNGSNLTPSTRMEKGTVFGSEENRLLSVALKVNEDCESRSNKNEN